MRRRTTLLTTRRGSTVEVPAPEAWRVVASGYERPQWYVDAAPFVFRGALDRVLGGEGRRWPLPGTPVLTTGDTAGFWRVVEADHEDTRLVLEAAVRAPGRVRLTTRVRAVDDEHCRVDQIVSFSPSGLLGAAYLLADLPARETLLELVHRRLVRDLLGPR